MLSAAVTDTANNSIFEFSVIEHICKDDFHTLQISLVLIFLESNSEMIQTLQVRVCPWRGPFSFRTRGHGKPVKHFNLIHLVAASTI
jgi:hypothetical protein